MFTNKNWIQNLVRSTVLIVLLLSLIVPGSQAPLAQGFSASPTPKFTVYPDNDTVVAADWPVGANLTITVDDPDTVPNPDYTTALIADSGGSRTFDLSSKIDIQMGFTVTLTDGSTLKTHLVVVEISSVSASEDIVYGQAVPAGIVVETYACSKWVCATRTETVDPGGLWQANFHVWGDQDWEFDTLDLVAGADGQTFSYDQDGDSTRVFWTIPNPRFAVDPDNDAVVASGWPPASELTIDVYINPAAPDPDFSQTVTVGSKGSASVPFSGIVDIQTGYKITATDGITPKSHIVTNLQITAQDPLTDTISGTAEPYSSVEVTACKATDPTDCGRRFESTDSGGFWQADFSQVGGGPWETVLIDLMPGVTGIAAQSDADNDQTELDWHIPAPYVKVYPNTDKVWAYDWTIGTDVTISVDDPGTGLNPDFSQTVTVVSTPGNPTYGSAEVDMSADIDIQAGFFITVTDGVRTKTLIATAVQVTSVDRDTDTIYGQAEPDSIVYISVCDPPDCVSRTEITDYDGFWQSTFAVPGDEPGETGLMDIVLGTSIDAYQLDLDGDSTNFALLTPPIISGNAGAADVSLDYYDGDPKTATSDVNGDYSFTVTYNWSGTVTPSRPDYVFEPVSLDYTDVQTDQTGQDYLAILITYRLYLPLVFRN
jgi:hypothetical protein